GKEAKGESALAMALSADGRLIAFASDASNLVRGDTNRCEQYAGSFGCTDVFVHDRASGSTKLVSVSSAGRHANDGSLSWKPAVSADGRYLGFESSASTLVSGDTNNHT